MSQRRATTPSIYHSLLPAGTPPFLPIPLPAPSTSRRADILEADTPPRKRLLLTAPTPRVEVGESSAAAAARQPGSTMAGRVNHNFVDIVDTRVRDTKRRTMVTVEVVNLRALARSEAYSKALEARIKVLETQAYRHEWQRHDTDDRVIKHIIRTQALEAGARVDTLEDQLGYDFTNPNGIVCKHKGVGTKPQFQEQVVRINGATTRECTYPDFMKCQPLNFKGTEVVVKLTQWIKKMEIVFRISNCSVENQIKFSTCTLLGNAPKRGETPTLGTVG
ncbi:hypothetical protein Tco_1505489 [Tanacetum coccineum]